MTSPLSNLDELTVTRRLASGGLRQEESLQYAVGLAQALRLLHEQGTICASLDPDRIVLSGSEVTLLQGGGGVLTPYSSPEQVRGEAVDARSDVFAYGAVIYELLSGRRAFWAEETEQLKRQILEHDPLPLTDVSEPIAQVLGRCLEKRPADRWQRMSFVLIELKLAIGNARQVQQATEWKEKLSSQRAQIAALEGRQAASHTAHLEKASELRQLIQYLEQKNDEQAEEMAKAHEELAALREKLAALQKTAQVHTHSIESLEAAAAQTDEVVEHVVEAFGVMHKSLVEGAEKKVIAISNNGV